MVVSTSTSASEFIPTAEELHALTCIPLDLDTSNPILDSQRATVARALFDIGLQKKAFRHDDCGLNITTHRCANGHLTHLVSRCGLSICAVCATKRAKELILDHIPIFAILEKEMPTAQGIYIELHLPCAADPTSVRQLFDSTTRTILSCLPDSGRALEAYDSHHDTNTFLWSFLPGRTSTNRLILRFLLAYSGPQADRLAIKSAFPQDGRSVVSLIHVRELSEMFKFIVQPVIPETPELAASMELAFTRVRRFRSMGTIENAEISVISTPSVTVISADAAGAEGTEDAAPAPEEPQYGKRCHICKAAIVSTETTRLSDTLRTH
jgi:hypothetical protein